MREMRYHWQQQKDALAKLLPTFRPHQVSTDEGTASLFTTTTTTTNQSAFLSKQDRK
jgi:hypothetical protein